MLVRIQQRKGTAAEWTTANPILAIGETGWELDTGRVKLGDGVLTWNLLPYAAALTVYVNATPDGVTENTAAVQAAHDALPATGGEVWFRPAAAAYIIGRVNITKPGVTIRIPVGTTLKRKAGITAGDRGMFTLTDLRPANFKITGGGIIDLNRAAYANGSPNSAIYAVRCSHIYVDGNTKVINGPESGYLFRNCGDLYLDPIILDNIHNIGVEVSFPAGFVGTYPDFQNYVINVTKGSRVDDGLLGGGNGQCVGAGIGLPGITPSGWHIEGDFEDNCIDVHFECNVPTSWFVAGKVNTLSTGAFRHSIGLVSTRGFRASTVCRNAGSAAAYAAGWDLSAVTLSSGTVSNLSDDVHIDAVVIDDRGLADQATVTPIRVNSAKSVSFGAIVVDIAANVGQTRPIRALNLENITGPVTFGSISAKVTNPSAGSIGLYSSIVTGPYYLGPNVFTGFASNIGGSVVPHVGWGTAFTVERDFRHTGSQFGVFGFAAARAADTADLKQVIASYGFLPSGGATPLDLQGGALTAGSVDVTTGDVVIRAAGKGIRANTADGADTTFLFVAGGGGSPPSDSRGAYLKAFGNEGASPGLLEFRAGNVAGAYITFQVGSERLRLDSTALTVTDAVNIVLGSTIGTKIGTATTQKLAFFNAAPIVQPVGTIDLRQALIDLGLYASGGATPLNLNGGLLTAAAVTASTGDVTISATDLVFGTSARGIRSNTTDAADNKALNICGGGGFSDSRGAYIQLSGNEASFTGRVDIRAGNVAGAYITFQAGGAERLRLDSTALTVTDAVNIVIGSTTGTKIGTATTQKLGLWNATPVVQPTGIVDVSGGATVDAEVRTAFNALLAKLEAVGLLAVA